MLLQLFAHDLALGERKNVVSKAGLSQIANLVQAITDEILHGLTWLKRQIWTILQGLSAYVITFGLYLVHTKLQLK